MSIKTRSKPIVMIHEVHDWMLGLDLSQYIITFDDGLYTQYKHLKHFLNFKTEKYFFVSTNIVNPIFTEQENDVIACSTAHKDFFTTGNTAPYMNWDQIREIAQSPNCFIGGHSHEHKDLRGNKDLKIVYEHLKNDTNKMLETFQREGIRVDSFCFPYNYEAPLYKEILKKEGIRTFFGKERIAIEELRK